MSDFHDQQFGAVHGHLGAGPLAEQDAVAGLHVQGAHRAVVFDGTAANSDDFAFHGLFLGGVGNDNPTLSGRLFLDALNQHAIMQGTKLHLGSLLFERDCSDVETVKVSQAARALALASLGC